MHEIKLDSLNAVPYHGGIEQHFKADSLFQNQYDDDKQNYLKEILCLRPEILKILFQMNHISFYADLLKIE